MTDETKETGSTDVLPFPETGTAQPSTDPTEIADEFIRAAQEAGAESGVTVGQAKRRGRAASVTPEPAPPPPPAIKWERDGIGALGAFVFDAILVNNDMPALEKDEQDKVKDVTALYLNLRVPRGAVVQPEVMIFGMVLSIVGPRLAGKRLAEEANNATTTTPGGVSRME